MDCPCVESDPASSLERFQRIRRTVLRPDGARSAPARPVDRSRHGQPAAEGAADPPRVDRVRNGAGPARLDRAGLRAAKRLRVAGVERRAATLVRSDLGSRSQPVAGDAVLGRPDGLGPDVAAGRSEPAPAGSCRGGCRVEPALDRLGRSRCRGAGTRDERAGNPGMCGPEALVEPSRGLVPDRPADPGARAAGALVRLHPLDLSIADLHVGRDAGASIRRALLAGSDRGARRDVRLGGPRAAQRDVGHRVRDAGCRGGRATET